MQNWHLCSAGLLLLLSVPTFGQEAPKVISDFQLADTAGKTWALADLKDRKAVVVVFLGTQCPINNAYLPRLAELHKTFSAEGVQFFAVNSNQHDSPRAIAEHARENNIPFPVLRDTQQKLADRFGAVRTPEVFVLDGKRTIVYQGRIDDQIGIGFQRPQATSHDLADALKEVLADKKVSRPVTQVAGCFITRSPRQTGEATVTFAKNVAGILQRNCQECHRPGQIGPMPLLTYEDASAWSSMIREVVEDKRMPPWHADPRHGKFSNNRSLSKQDYDTLLSWIDQGCPPGDSKDAPPARQFPEGWTIGKPDVVLSMPRDFTVPATAPKGGVKYQTFLVPTNFTEDKWAQAIEVRPGSKATVHHIIVFVVEGRKKGAMADGIGKGMLGVYAPGDMGSVFPAGTAKKIPKGATLAFQVHYTPNGVEQTDRSSRRHRLRQGAAPPPGQHARHRPAGTLHRPRHGQPGGPVDVNLQGGNAAVEPVPAHASARQELRVQGRLSRRHIANAAVGAEMRLQLASVLPSGRAAASAGRQPDRVPGHVRQFPQQPQQSRSVEMGLLGQSDLGGNDDRFCRLYHGRAVIMKIFTTEAQSGTTAIAMPGRDRLLCVSVPLWFNALNHRGTETRREKKSVNCLANIRSAMYHQDDS